MQLKVQMKQKTRATPLADKDKTFPFALRVGDLLTPFDNNTFAG
jgi:hypothetical protein